MATLIDQSASFRKKYKSKFFTECFNLNLNLVYVFASYENRGKLKKCLKKPFGNAGSGMRRVMFLCSFFLLWCLLFFFSLVSKGVFLSISYFFIKLVYAAVAIIQVFLLNYWFRDDYYGKRDKLSFFFSDHNWKLAERFPRMTLCRFQVYILTEQQTHVIDCLNLKISLNCFENGFWILF